jgi:hypothetical protein
MIISIVSASSFFVCLGLGCKNSSKSRAWIFGKEHMIVNFEALSNYIL